MSKTFNLSPARPVVATNNNTKNEKAIRVSEESICFMGFDEDVSSRVGLCPAH
jgi:hypothetical protein